MSEDPVLSEKIGLFLNVSLDNAIENKSNIILNPITYEKIEKALNNKSKSKQFTYLLIIIFIFYILKVTIVFVRKEKYGKGRY